MKRLICYFLLLASLSGFAQSSLNNYKYVLVPEKFEFLRDADQYALNSLMKSLLETKGFTVHWDNVNMPKELASDRCQTLKADLEQRKAIFSTNLTLTLKDCQGNVVYKSKEGKSREKEWMAAYQEALTEAFKSLNDVPYAYNGGAATTARATTEGSGTTPPATTPTSTPAATPAVPAAPASAPATPVATETAGTLYAQATANGFQLIDTTPKIVMTLLKTSTADTFIAEKGAAHGIVFKKNGEWFFEYYADGKLVAEKLAIKF